MKARAAALLLLESYRRLPWLLRLSAVFAWAGVIWWASSRQGSPGTASLAKVLLSNSAHFFVFGLLSGLLFALFSRKSRGRVAAALLLSIAYGVMDEFHQASVPGRDASWSDVLTDCCGAVAMVSLALWLEQPTTGRWQGTLGATVLGAVAVIVASV